METNQPTILKRYGYYIAAAILIILCIGLYTCGYRQGKASQAKEQYKDKEREIAAKEAEKKQDAIQVSGESKKAVEKAKIIIKNVPVYPPAVKDTTTNYMYEYLKTVKP